MKLYIISFFSLASGILANCPAKLMCYVAGNLNSVPIISNFPPCWVNAGDYWGCFDLVNNSCDYINYQKGYRIDEMQACVDRGETIQAEKNDIKAASIFPAPAKCLSKLKCYHGSQVHVPETTNFPRCWINHGSIWGCYNPVDNSCSNVNGIKMIEFEDIKCKIPPTTELPSIQSFCPDLLLHKCYPDSDLNKIPIAHEYPSYWVWEDNYWGCYVDEPKLIGKNFINLNHPPSHCQINGASPYTCS